MEHSSHFHPIDLSHSVGQNEVLYLADAFSQFMSASTRLEASYAQLQSEVAHLSRELADRNAALNASLAENERVHGALQNIVDSMPCGILVVEAKGAVIMINPEGRRLLDLETQACEHLKSISASAGIDLQGFLCRHTGAEEEQEFCRTGAGGRRWLSVHKRWLFREDAASSSGDRSAQTILILRDVTLHKQAEAERERARKAFALSEVATTLAHEIRNPLASMELFAGLIAKGGEETAEWISHLHAGIRSLAGTVNNVLSLNGVGAPVLVPIDLAQSIRSSVEFTRPIAEQAGVELAFECDAPGMQVLGNSSALQQVVLNLVCNAIRHTDAQGRVCISVHRLGAAAKQDRELALVECIDSGRGIAPEHLGEIFRAGFSGSGTTSGLGLAVCQQIAKQHHGEIRVASTLGAGTTFALEIPTV